jgi:hypothetical protein
MRPDTDIQTNKQYVYIQTDLMGRQRQPHQPRRRARRYHPTNTRHLRPRRPTPRPLTPNPVGAAFLPSHEAAEGGVCRQRGEGPVEHWEVDEEVRGARVDAVLRKVV